MMGYEGAISRVPDEELDYDEELIHRYRGVPYTGIGYDVQSDNGSSEITYLAGVQEGPSRDWYPSGILKGETFYRNNLQHGSLRDYREDGSLELEAHYEYGILVSSLRFDKDRKVIERYVLPAESPLYGTLQRFRALNLHGR